MTERRVLATVAFSVAVWVAIGPGPGGARGAPAPPQRSARQIMEEVDRRHRTDAQYSEGLITVEEKGKVRKKAWRSWRTGWGPAARDLVQFLDPPEVKGVGLLTIARPGQADEQWFYTPAIDRDRRIARQEKSTRFLGTHFTYEDMEERDLDDYTYELSGEQAIDGAACWKIIGTPAGSKESQYSRLLFWVRQDFFTSVRIEGFEGEAPRRTFIGTDVAEVEGIPTVRRWEVSDTRREGKTTLELKGLRYRAPVDSGIFTIQGLRTLHDPPAPSAR